MFDDSKPFITNHYCDTPLIEIGVSDSERLGILCRGTHRPIIRVANLNNVIGSINIECTKPGCQFLFDNSVNQSGVLFGHIRMHGDNGCCYFAGTANGMINLTTIFFRAPNQTLFWGRNSTAVGLLIEIEGSGKRVLVGDDCLFSSGIQIRNYDMHTIFDIASGTIINRPPCDVVIEQHVWVGSEVLLLSLERIGFGSIIGAGSIVKNEVDPMCICAGVPAKVIRTGVSWSMEVQNVSDKTKNRLSSLMQINRETRKSLHLGDIKSR
jgi:carbonic anhydrase/acetyltransferase-like protein (isoleucine patch superfamily)